MHKSKLVKIAVLAGLGILPLSVHATNGMNPEGTGVKNRGMGGAGVAIANETASITNNPAAVVAVGDRWDVAVGLFSPKPRSYSLVNNNIGFGTGASNINFEGSQESDSNYFVIPFFGIAFPIDSTSAWSIVINANGGMNTDYPDNFGSKLPSLSGAGGTGINLAQLFANATYGRTVSPGIDVGATLIVAYQTFEAKGLEAFQGASRDPSAVTNNGTDSATGIGIKLGIRADVGSGVTLGATYQSKIKMSAFDRYKGLFPDQGELDIAPTYSVGVAWKSSPKLTVAFDYLYIDYSGVNAIGNSTSLFSPAGSPNTCASNTGSVCFGDSGGPGFGWKSINVFKLGFEYATSDDWTWRAGWNHGDNPISPSEVSVNFLAPGVIEDHLTLGFTHKLDKNSELSANFVHSFNNSVSGDFSPLFGGGTMKLEMTQNYLEVGYGKKF
jgi:long-chain fatty acid transport protein